MEQLQLVVEEQLFNQDEGSLVEMIEILGIVDDLLVKIKMQKIEIIRKEIDSKLQSDEKVTRTCLEQLLIGSLSMQRFWATDGHRKCAVFLFYLSSHYQIYIFKFLCASRDDYFENLGETYVLACKMFTSGCRPWLFAYMKGTVPPSRTKGRIN